MTKADLVDKIHAKAGLGTKAATEHPEEDEELDPEEDTYL